jgi:hypothetical protein
MESVDPHGPVPQPIPFVGVVIRPDVTVHRPRRITRPGDAIAARDRPSRHETSDGAGHRSSAEDRDAQPVVMSELIALMPKPVARPWGSVKRADAVG